MTADRRPLREAVRDMLSAAPTLPEDVDADAVQSWEVRLLCPGGHFCVYAGVIELRDDLVLLEPLGKDRQLSTDAEALADLIKSGRSRPPRRSTEWIRHSGNRVGVYSRTEVVVECVNKKCSYSGAFEYFALADQVRSATAARRGESRIEYRLTE
jgi:hypothetical protein